MNVTEKKMVEIVDKMLQAFPKPINEKGILKASKNTWVAEYIKGNRDDHIVVFLHGNAIVSIYPREGKININDMGWHTRLTKSRLNAIYYIPTLTTEQLYQQNYDWYFKNGKAFNGFATFFFFHPSYEPREVKKPHYALGKTQKQRKQEMEMNFRYA